MDQNLEQVLSKFEQYLYARKGFHHNTVYGYIHHIKRLAAVVGLTPSHSDLDKYVSDMMRAGASYSYIMSVSNAIERYMEFIGNPIKFGRPRKPKQIIKETLTEAEIARDDCSMRHFAEKGDVVVASVLWN